MQNLPGKFSFKYIILNLHYLGEYPHSVHLQVCWMAYRKYSAMTPGGMNKDLGLKFAGQSKGKKATTLFLVLL